MAAPAQSVEEFISILSIAGRNGSDSHFTIPDQQCLEAMNIDFYRTSLARRRGGSKVIGLTGGTAFNNVKALHRHVPSDDPSVAEFWAVDGNFLVKRLAGGVAWANVVTTQDPPTASAERVCFWSFNGKLFAAFKNAHNRLHVWDGTTWRRVGLDLPNTPAIGVLAGGAVTDTRKYRVSWVKQDAGGNKLYRSNLSAASASAAMVAQQVPVTRPVLPGEGETHWELWAASTPAFADYRLLATTVVGTATVNDNNAALPATVAPADGANTPPPSAKVIVSDDARLIMAGAWEVGGSAENAMVPTAFRVWYTSLVSDPSNVGNDERISNTGTINNYTDLDEAPVGISPPIHMGNGNYVLGGSSLALGVFYVFSSNSHYKFIPTGDSTNPYSHFKIQGGRGTLFHKSIVVAEDANGSPSIYWAAPEGIHRILATEGQEWVGEDIIDIWARVNVDATIPCCSKFYRELHQVWFFVAVDGSDTPNLRLVYDTRLGKFTEASGVRGGWSQADGNGAKVFCVEMFSDTIGASMGRRLKPHIGSTVVATDIWKCDTTDMDDNGTQFQAYLDTKSYMPWGAGRQGGISHDPILLAKAQGGTIVSLKAYWKEGADFQLSYADLSAPSDSAQETHVFPKFEGCKLGDTPTIRFRIGDDDVKAAQWTLDGLIVPVSAQGDI